MTYFLNTDKVYADNREQIEAHVLREYPKEAGGYFVRGKYVPMKNVSLSPKPVSYTHLTLPTNREV